MADVTKTAALVFTGDATQAEASINKLAQSLEKLGSESPTEIKGLTDAVKSVGDSSKVSAAGVDVLKKELDDLATKAGLPAGTLTKLDDAFKSIGVGGTASALLAATAVTLFVAAAADGAQEVGNLRTSISNLSGSSTEGGQAVDFLREVVKRLETDLGDTAKLYTEFRKDIAGTGIDARTAEKAFYAVALAVKGVGGDAGETKQALAAFADIIKDGSISVSELDGKLLKVPGALDELTKITGKSAEELKEFAKEGLLGRDVIDALITSLSNREVESTTPIKDAFNDLVNVIKEFGLIAGAEGAFNFAVSAIELSLRGVASVVSGVSGVFEILGRTIANVIYSLKDDQSFTRFWERQKELVDEVSARVTRTVSKFSEYGEEGKKAANQITVGLGELGQETEKTGKKSEDLNKSLRTLGLDPKNFTQPVEEIVGAFAKLSVDSKASTEQIISGLLAALTKVSDPAIIDALGQYAKSALEARGSTDGLVAVTNALAQAKEGTLPKFDKFEKSVKAEQKALKEAAKEAEKARERAEKFALEMEKLASNERIKAIEFKVQLDIAKVQADTEKFKATLESLNKGLESTGQVISAAFGALSGVGGFYGLEKLAIIQEQLKKENEFRQQQFDLQKELVTEQIKRLKAQTEAAERGDGIIKIDGSGLAPQLEAFMFEVLRAIQVRVNADGLPLLLGV